MKKILVGTDFSNNSHTAIHYALELAKTFSSEVELFNSFVTVPAIGIDGGPGMINETIIAAGMENGKKKLEELLASLSSIPGVKISSRVSSGDPVLSMCDYVKEKKHDLIVLGTQGESRFEEILFGGTTIDVMKLAPCPVLAVPPDSKFHGVKKIVYATDFEAKDIDVIGHLCEMASKLDAEVVVFHAFAEKTVTAEKEASDFDAALRKKITYRKLKEESVLYDNVQDAILNAIKKDLANIVVMREKKRGIFSRFFHPDMVKKINYHTNIPLLVYNDNSI